MKYVILNSAEAKAHGIVIIPTMRQSIDKTQVVLHEGYIKNIDEFNSLQRYEFDSPEFTEIINGEDWVHGEEYEAPNEKFAQVMALQLMTKDTTNNINTYELSAKDALAVREFYPLWRESIEVKEGERYQSDGLLWECISGHTTQANWKPSISTSSLWKEVTTSHAGTKEDPIPYHNNMELELGKYYSQYDVVYLCTRDTEIPVYQDLKDLEGIYVQAQK